MTAAAEVARSFAHLHADVTRVLGGWSAPDAAQEELRRSYLTFLASHPDGVAKAGPPAHLTASCVVLDAAGERVLLTHHRRARQWFQFGGHLERADVSLWAAARREGREESGLAALEPLRDPVQLDRHVLEGDFGHCREHLDVRFAAVAPEGVGPTVSDESLDVRWWPVDALPEGTRAELSPLVAVARGALGLL
ncbi:NUDIX domain-containing protein [Phycicoccus sp. HDW14]|uniref:NUDIX hydrolase n=1 Tax=Phycicoccus sp. HDW14 TaxID=2714941 RepID=UPI001409722C|nr:NUDIX domain-containing protein [Phycicoccus sp. HDW14]QIM20251.1 NUDIX domain-containing protein [Phycicoccus sp. HDW14]